MNRSKIGSWIKKNKTGYLFLLPFLILFTAFTIVPVAVAMGTSFTNYNMIQRPGFVALDNYAFLLLDDDVFLKALQNTLIFALVTGPVGYLASFFMAWIITLVKKGKGFFSLAFYAPSLTSGVARAGTVGAATLITTLPSIIVFAIFRGKVMETMTYSGIKS